MTKKEIHIGMIGAGMIAQEHVRNLKRIEGVRVSWVADNNEALLEKVRKRFRIPWGHHDYTRMLEYPQLDAVFICTPPDTHYEIFVRAVQAGKHILMEKPASTREHELKEMVALAEAHPRLVICDASCRHSRLQPKFPFIKKFIDSGRLGEVYFIHHNAAARQFRPGIEYNPPAKWFLDRKISGGGPVLDWGVYDLSFHLGILSDTPELESVRAMTKNRLDDKDPGTDIYDVEEHAAVYMKFTGGLTYYWERAAHANVEVPSETRIYGTRGGLKFSYLTWDSPEVVHYYLTRGGKAKSRTLQVDMSNHRGDHFEMARHFVHLLHRKKAPAIPLALAAKHLKIAMEVYNAAEKPE